MTVGVRFLSLRPIALPNTDADSVPLANSGRYRLAPGQQASFSDTLVQPALAELAWCVDSARGVRVSKEVHKEGRRVTTTFRFELEPGVREARVRLSLVAVPRRPGFEPVVNSSREYVLTRCASDQR